MRLVQAMDYCSMYLAKHLLWVATNGIDTYFLRKNTISRCPNRGALIDVNRGGVYDGTSSMMARFYRNDARVETTLEYVTRILSAGQWSFPSAWWIGASAPHFSDQLLSQVAPVNECHCGSGLPYGSCCRTLDLRRVS